MAGGVETVAMLYNMDAIDGQWRSGTFVDNWDS